MLSTSPLYAQATQFTVTVSFANILAGASAASPIIQPRRGAKVSRSHANSEAVAIAWPAARDGVGYLHSSWGTFARGRRRRAVEAAQPVAVQIDPQPGPLTPQPVSRVLLPSHIVGVGGRIGTQALSGFAAMGRLWFARHVGAQLELGRATHTNPAMLRMNVTDIGVNAITSLPDLVTNAVWMRPYVGGG